MEVCVTFPKYKKFVNRGFMLGPYCPIYGYSSIIMILYLNHYKDNPLTVFLLAVVVCSFIEYMVSYFMEKIFKARWWDYSNRKFNINGRVCLNYAIFFGVLGTFLVYFANPFFEGLLLKINTNTLNIISLILLIIFTFDFIISMYASFKLKNSLSKIDKNSTEQIKEKIKEIETIKDISKEYLEVKNFFSKADKNIKKIEIIPSVYDNNTKIKETYHKENSDDKPQEELKLIEIGKNVHTFFERINFIDNKLPYIEDNYYKEKLTKFLNSDFMNKYKEYTKYQEYEFIYQKSNETYHGKIDLLLVGDKEAIIIDYKLKNTKDKAYIEQLNGYKEVITNKLNLPTTCYLYSIIAEKFEKI